MLLFSIVVPITIGYNVKSTNEKGSQSISSFHDGLMDSPWPMFSHDTRHTGCSIYGKLGTWWKEKWKANIGSMVFSSPAIDKNGTIYIGSNNYNIYAINPNGTRKWSYKTNEAIESSPAIAEDGTVYVGSCDGKLYAFYPNGTVKWSIRPGDGSIYSSPVIDDDGIIYIGMTQGKNICAINPNGTRKWSYKTGNLIYSTPALDDDTVYCGSYDGYMYALYKNNGTLKWRYKTGGWCGGDGATIDKDGTIYFGNYGSGKGYFFALNSNGTLKWKKQLGSNVVPSPAISEDGTIYVAAYKGYTSAYIYSFKPDGTLNWRYEYLTEYISTSPAIDKYGVIYFGTWDGYLLAMNPDGTLRWSYKALDEIVSSPAIGEDGTIYFGSETVDFTAKLFAIEPIEGNSPPDMPYISGPKEIDTFHEFTFTFETNDVDGDKVCFFIIWDDHVESDCTEFVPSGTSTKLSHRFEYLGRPYYRIRVQAWDEHGAWSDWTSYQVDFKPKTRSWIGFIDMFPILQRLFAFIK